jgi:hypothetical protein
LRRRSTGAATGKKKEQAMGKKEQAVEKEKQTTGRG